MFCCVAPRADIPLISQHWSVIVDAELFTFIDVVVKLSQFAAYFPDVSQAIVDTK